MEASTWQEDALETTGVIESLKKSIFTLEIEADRVSAQRANLLESAKTFIYSLQVAIPARGREISLLTRLFAESRAQQVVLYAVATAYYQPSARSHHSHV